MKTAADNKLVRKVNDLFEMTQRRVTNQGYLIVDNCALARDGIYEYRAFELGLTDVLNVDPAKIIRVYRPADEVFAEDSVKSFEHLPITLGHPEENVQAENWPQLAKGEVCNVKQSDHIMQGTLVIKSKDAIDAVNAGKTALSNGYTCDLELVNGTFNGQVYDAVQRSIRGNHVAIVDKARCGSVCKISDSETTNMPGKTVIDGIPLEGSEQVIAMLEKLNTKVNTLEKQNSELVQARDAASTELAASKKIVEARDSEIVQLKKDVVTPEMRDAMVLDWAKTIASAKKLVPEIVTDGKTCLAIRREVLETKAKDQTAKSLLDAVVGANADFKTLDADKVRIAFNALDAIQVTDVAKPGSSVADAFTGAKPASKPVKSGRNAMLARLNTAWKQS